MPIAARAKRRLFVLAAAGLTVVGASACDASSGPVVAPSDQPQHAVTVIGSGEVQGTPDTLNVNASIEFIAPDVTGAMNQTSDRQNAVIQALVDAGVDRKDINTSQVSLQPQFTGGGDNPQTIVGYRASNSIDIKIRQLDAASQALALIVSSGGDATRINNVNYSIEDDSELIRDARSRAFEDAKDRAEQYAQLSAMSLGKVVSISESAGRQPPVPYRGDQEMAMAAPVPLEPGQQTVGFSVTVVWELA